jgi:hypothetical protein
LGAAVALEQLTAGGVSQLLGNRSSFMKPLHGNFSDVICITPQRSTHGLMTLLLV